MQVGRIHNHKYAGKGFSGNVKILTGVAKKNNCGHCRPPFLPKEKIDVLKVKTFLAELCAMTILHEYSNSDAVAKSSEIKEKGLHSKVLSEEILPEAVCDIVMKSPNVLTKADYRYFGLKKIPLTSYDTQAVLDARYDSISTPSFTEDSEEFLVNKDSIIANELEKMEKIPADKKLVFVTGLSASGKSYYISQHYIDDYYVADVDLVKKEFPSYEETGKRTNCLHEVSKHLVYETILPTAILSGKNVVIPTTGLSNFIERIAKPAHDLGYSIEVIQIDIDKEKAMQNVVTRLNKIGRFVDPLFVLKRAQDIEKQPELLKKAEFIDKVTVIHNDNI